MNSKHILIIHTSSSFNNANARESVDLALIFAAFEQRVSLLFRDDGIWQLLAQQNAKAIGHKDFLATMKAYQLYDIEQIYVCGASLTQRGISEQQLQLAPALLTAQQQQQLLTEADHVIVL